jgi:hypothetical protein
VERHGLLGHLTSLQLTQEKTPNIHAIIARRPIHGKATAGRPLADRNPEMVAATACIRYRLGG